MIAQPEFVPKYPLKMTVEEYLEFDSKALEKHEFVDGWVFPVHRDVDLMTGEILGMSGASRNHNLITANVLAQLHFRLRSRSCEVYVGDMRVALNRQGLYAYPDVVVACDSPEFLENTFDTLANPTVIVEVLSLSTAPYDRGDKFDQYRKIESLREYVTVAQDRSKITHYKRIGRNQWILTDITQGILSLESIGCELEVEDIYEKVSFEEGSR